MAITNSNCLRALSTEMKNRMAAFSIGAAGVIVTAVSAVKIANNTHSHGWQTELALIGCLVGITTTAISIFLCWANHNILSQLGNISRDNYSPTSPRYERLSNDEDDKQPKVWI